MTLSPHRPGKMQTQPPLRSMATGTRISRSSARSPPLTAAMLITVRPSLPPLSKGKHAEAARVESQALLAGLCGVPQICEGNGRDGMGGLLFQHSSPLLPSIGRAASVCVIFTFISKRTFEMDPINLRPRSIDFNASVCESAAHKRFNQHVELHCSNSQQSRHAQLRKDDSGWCCISTSIVDATIDEPLRLPLGISESSVGRKEIKLLGKAYDGRSTRVRGKDRPGDSVSNLLAIQ